MIENDNRCKALDLNDTISSIILAQWLVRAANVSVQFFFLN